MSRSRPPVPPSQLAGLLGMAAARQSASATARSLIVEHQRLAGTARSASAPQRLFSEAEGPDPSVASFSPGAIA